MKHRMMREPGLSRSVSNKEFFLIVLVTLELFVIGVWIIGPFIPDDSFISFRYAEHLAGGSGLRFNNPGAPVEGYSNFLWVVICALLSLFSPLPQIAPLAGEVLGGLCIVMLGVLLRRSAENWIEIALPLAFLSISGPFLLYSASGMETPLFVR